MWQASETPQVFSADEWRIWLKGLGLTDSDPLPETSELVYRLEDPDEMEFPRWLYGHGVEDERVNELCNGAQPTAEEMELYREVCQQQDFFDIAWIISFTLPYGQLHFAILGDWDGPGGPLKDVIRGPFRLLDEAKLAKQDLMSDWYGCGD
jgi:hypothetical protein